MIPRDVIKTASSPTGRVNPPVGFFVRSTLIIGLSVALAPPAIAQTFNVLHTFTEVSGPIATNSDGANPYAELSLSGNVLYGTAKYGGKSGAGTVFSLNTDGAGFATAHHFTGGADGANPYAGLISSSNTLYGTASAGGNFNSGVVFSVKTNGNDFAVLHNFTTRANNSFGVFTNSDGAHPYAGLILTNNILYGAANDGGTSGHGTLFAINTDGSVFATMHSFSSGSGGAFSAAGLVLFGDALYGTDFSTLGNGAVFAIFTSGTGFTNYYAFTISHLNSSGVLTNSDGANPHANLILSGNTLYGTTAYSGEAGNGTVFAVNTDGTGFVNLHSFAKGGYNQSGLFTNSDGANPLAGLTLANNRLYGTASAGGRSGNGTVFMLSLDGSGFTNLYDFTAMPPYPAFQTNSDGANPFAGLVVSNNILYGTTAYGGTSGNGTAFALSFAPQLNITLFSGTNVVLTWPSGVAGFDYTGYGLQSAAEITGPFTNITGATNPFTNSIAGAQQFYRLRK